MEVLALLEELAPVRALKSSFYAYPLVNALHILSIGGLVTSAILMDLRILGLFAALDRQAFIRLTRRAAIVAFCGAVLTGVPMFAIRASEYFFNPAFRLKMFLIALAGLNILALRLFAPYSTGVPVEGRLSRTSAVVSLGLWIGVLVCGRFIGFV